MKKIIAIPAFLVVTYCVLALGFNTGCHIYSFKDVSPLPDSVKTVNVHFIENRAPYVNPQLSPSLTDKLKQKIVSQTRLTQTTSDNAHYDITGYISDYSVSTSGVSANNGKTQTSVNRLTVSVNITLNKQIDPNSQPQNFTVSRSFDFGASQSLQTAEAQLLDEMVRNLTDEIFNHIFSNW